MSFGVALSMRHQAIANQPRANAVGVAAFADRGQHRAVDDRRVRGPDAAVLRIDDARELGGGEVAVPAARAVGPRFGRHAVVADARGIAPPIVHAMRPGVVAHRHVLVRDAEAGDGRRAGRRPIARARAW